MPRFQKGSKAGSVKTVAALEKLRGLPRRVERLEADRAVVEGRIGGARVRVENRGLHTRPALVAVRVGFLAAHAANPALVAVILPLVHVVEQDTDRAPIGAEGHTTRDAGWAGLLLRIAPHTLDDLDGLPVQLVSLLRVGVPFVFRGVVAEAAGEEFAAARGQQGRLAFVVVAAFVRSRHSAEVLGALRMMQCVRFRLVDVPTSVPAVSTPFARAVFSTPYEMSGTPFRKRTGSEEEVAYGNGSAMARNSKALNLFADFQKAAAAGNVSAYGALAMSESELRKAAAAKAAATKAAKAEAKAAAAAKAKATRNAKKAATAAGGAGAAATAAGGAGRGNNNNNTRNNRSNRTEEKELDALTALIQTWVIAKKDPGYVGRLFGALKKTPEIVKAHVTKDQAALLTKRSFVTKLEAKFTAPNV